MSSPVQRTFPGILAVLMLLLLAIQIPVKASDVMSLFFDHKDGEGTAPTLTLSQTPVSCYGRTDGSITAQASGGIAPYQFSKDNGTSWQNDRYFERLGAGRYTIIVKDNEGARSSVSITVTSPSAVSATAKPYPARCHDSENGSIIITASGGTAPYQYFLDGGPNWQYDAHFKEVHTGSHIIYVRDGQECMIQLMADITAPPPLTVSAQHENVTCNQEKDGRITVEAAGGTPPYQYSKDKGSNWQLAPTFAELAQGEHEILVRDRNGCVAGTTVNITAPLALNISTETTDVSCNSACNGRIVIKATGGVAPYRYSNNQGLTWQQTPDFPGISAGVYYLAVKDSNGCVIRKSVKLSEPTGLSVVSSSATFASATDCSLTVAASGGIPAYSFSMDQGKTWQDSATFAHIGTGAHSILVKDNNGCSRGLTVTLANQPLQLVVDSWGASCFGAATARIVVKVQDGTPPYRYSIDKGFSWQVQSTFNTRAGVYTILAQDQSGKRGSVKVQVGEPALLTASVETRDVSCHNAANGIITPMVAGGALPYKYSLNNGETWQSSPGFAGLPGGSYALLIKDSYGCGVNLSTTIQEPTVLSTRIQSNSTSCYGRPDGSFQVVSSGGTPPYQYSLDSGHHWQDTALFTGLAAGNYRLLIRDYKGCTDSAKVEVKAPMPVTFTAGSKQVSCNGGADGSITIAAQGGTTPYRYSMDNVHWQDATLFDSLRAGRFTLVVEDTRGCSKKANVVVTEPALLRLALESATNGCSYSGAQIQVKANGGTLPYLYTTADSISSTDGRFSALETGSYVVMVKDKNGCVDSLDPVSIMVSPALYLNLTTKTDMECDGIHKGSVILMADGGISPYKYELNGKTLPSLNIPGLDNGAYEAVVRDQNGCIATQRFDIILRDEQCELNMPSGFSPNGDGRNDIFRPALYGNISQYKLEVFNAWGNLVFASSDPETGWNGAFKGKPQAGGTYVWMARYTSYKGIVKVKRGVVTLVR